MALLVNLIKAFLVASIAFKCGICNELGKPLNLMPIVDMINNDPNAGWTAGVNEGFSNVTMRALGGLILSEEVPSPPRQSPDELKALMQQYPDCFDARTYWNCPSMWRILNQGSCGACWAFSSVQVLQDRLCIEFGVNVKLSPNNVLTCCSTCGNCTSGYLYRAFDYLEITGTVTEECSPYFDTASCALAGCKAPACKRACEDYSDSRKRYHTSRLRYVKGVDKIMNEIMTKGPVSAAIYAYKDLLTYKSGVYQHLTGDFLLGHAVKLVGWGTTAEGQDYWIATNQWGSKWGENGHFRIRRGVNECNVERWVTTADAVNPQNYLVSDV